MRFKPELAEFQLPAELLEQDYARARSVGKVHLGERCMFFQKLSGALYLPYGQMIRAWLRQEEVKARLCCGTANFDQFYLVVVCTDNREYRWHIPDKASGQSCIDHISTHNPEVKIGYVKPKE